jgi:type IV secretion system protein VirB10
MTSLFKHILAVALCLSPGLAADPDFSGAWKLNRERSTLGRLPVPPASEMQIEQRGATLRCIETPVVWSAAFDGKASKASSGGVVTNTVLKWEGRALLINTLVSGSHGGYTQMDRWELSRNGATLTIRREIVRLGGESESTLVYERPRPVEPVRQAAAEPQRPVQRFVVPAGTNVPLLLINSLSSKQSGEGDRVYLRTAYPILADGRVVIPPGSYVAGTLTHVKRPGRVKGRGELFLRFDSLTLPNGVTRDFRSRVGAIDGQAAGEFDRKEGKISGAGNKSGDARTVGEAAGVGATVGGLATRSAAGVGIGAAAGAAAGLAGVLLSRGPDAVLPRGSSLEMVLDRPLAFDENELDDGPAPAARR